jgi:hypothetical protein
MANQKPDAGQFDDVGFLIFGRSPQDRSIRQGKRMAQLSPYLNGEIPKNIVIGIHRSI